MFESTAARSFTSGAFLVFFAYLEHELKLGVVASGLLTFMLVRKRCQRWLSLALFLCEVGLLYYAEMKYASFLPFLLLELVCLLCNPVGDVSKINGWRPYEREIRQFLMENDPSVLHRVDDALDEYANKEKELYSLLVRSYAKKAASATSGSSSSRNNPSDRKNEVVREIRSIMHQHAPHLVHRVDQMLLEYQGNEEELLVGLKNEFDVGDDDRQYRGGGSSSSSSSSSSSHQRGSGGGSGGASQTPLTASKSTGNGNGNGNGNTPSTFGSGHKKWTHRDSEIIENAKWEAQQRIQQRMQESVAALRR